MLDESPPQGHIDDLRTSTDSEGGKLRGHGVSGQCQFNLIAFRVYHVNGLMTNSPVERRIDIPSAGQQQAVKMQEELLPVGLARRKQDWKTTGAPDSLYVLGAKVESVVFIPPVGCNANQGSHHFSASFKTTFPFPFATDASGPLTFLSL